MPFRIRISHAIAFETLLALGRKRWLFVVAVFFALGWIESDSVRFSYGGDPLEPNIWDLPLTLASNQAVLLFFFAFGFATVAADTYVADITAGTATTTLLRSKSRSSWWSAKVISLGPLALVFSCLALISILAAALLTLPAGTGPSQAALTPYNSPDALYPWFRSIPIPVFLLLVALNLAVVLWAIGAVVLTVSVFLPNPVAPLVVSLVWIVGLSWLLSPSGSGIGVAAFANPTSHLSYAIHFGDLRVSGIRWWTSLLISAGYIVASVILGSVRLKRVDL